MRIGIDCHVIGGMEQGSASVLLNFLEQIPPGHEYVLYSFDVSRTRRLFRGSQFIHRGIPIRNSLFRIPLLFPYLARRDKCDLFHFNYYSPPLGIRSSILTIHDVIYLDFPEFAPAMRRLQFDSLTRLSAHTAKHILTISEYSKQRILQHFNVPESKITVIPNGLSNSWLHPDLDHIASVWSAIQHRFPRKFALTVGRFDPRKNIPQAARVIRRMVDDGLLDGLVVVGPPDFGAKSIMDRMRADDTLRYVTHSSGLSRSELQALYSNAQFLIYLSLAEGFGMPLIEAMAMGTPILASNRTAIPEICGEAAVIVDPDDFEATLSGAVRMIKSEETSLELREKGKQRVTHFEAEQVSEAIGRLYRQIA
ncbi:MAG: glycosyltransferase family 4 protein [Nitrososphaerota archaeon]|nr:glycosyltransferase family 4 protein [Nitrososphaerota archaeon]